MALATLVQGSTGLEVKNLQRALNYHLPEDLPRLNVDGMGTLKGGPTVETKDGRFSFGAGGYLEYKSNGAEHEMSAGVFVEGGFRF